MDDKFLIMVDPNNNNNKFYNMFDEGNTVRVEYGRVGKTKVVKRYPSSEYWRKYNEKVNKGYVDQTGLHLSDDIPVKKNTSKTEYAKITKYAIAKIVDRLISMAKQTISHNYIVTADKVTREMCDAAQYLIDRLIRLTDLSEFNEILIKLFETIPRNMDKVNNYIAHNPSDRARIIQREQDLLDVMRGQVSNNPAGAADADQHAEIENKKSLNLLESLGLEMDEASDEEVAMIKKRLGDSSDRFKAAWKVNNAKTEKAFSSYVKEHKAKTDLLWHGSRNENWWSIVKLGLVLHPSNAVISGHMFGIGTYFADKARKSIGYSSVDGSYWARGNSSSGFLALYDVAVGNSYHVRSWRNELTQFNYNRLQTAQPGADSLFAHQGADLRNNEIIVYREDQTTIRYLVEIG